MTEQMRQAIDTVLFSPTVYLQECEIEAKDVQGRRKDFGINPQDLRIEESRGSMAGEAFEPTLENQDKQSIKKKKLQLLTSAAKAYLGISGQRYGTWAKHHFLTPRHPKLNKNEATTVVIRGKQYKSKPYCLWLYFGSITMIPLEQEPEGQLDIVDIYKLDHSHNIYLFYEKDGKTLYIPLKLQVNYLGEKYIKCEDSLISQIHNGSPVMTIYNNKPALIYLRDYISGQIESFWSFRSNLDNTKMDQLVYAHAQIRRLQSKIDEFAQPGSNVSYSIFSSSQRQSIEKCQAEQVYRILGSDERKGLQELKVQIEQIQSKKQALREKIQQTCHKRRIYGVNIEELLQCQSQKDTKQSKATSSNSGQLILDSEDKYEGHYDINCAITKIIRADCKKFMNLNCLELLVDRHYQTMRLIASWPIPEGQYHNHHIMPVSQLKHSFNSDQRPQFSYRTLKCECPCRSATGTDKARLHRQGIFKIILDKPFLWLVAVLDAVKQLEKNFIIHKDIEIGNFIYYKQDFILIDFDMSCFVKSSGLIMAYNDIQRQLNLLNIALIEKCKYVLEIPQVEDERLIDIFFRDVTEKLTVSESTHSTLSRLDINKTKSHQKQISNILKQLSRFGSKCNIQQNHLKQIYQMFESNKSNEEILKWAEEKLKGSSFQNVMVPI